MISESGLGEWKPQNQDDTQKIDTQHDGQLSEEEAFEEASRMRWKIDREGGETDYNEAEEIAEAEKASEDQVQRKVEKMVGAFHNDPIGLAEAMRDVSPRLIRALARAFRGESYITVFGTFNPDDESLSEVQMRLWSEQPDLNREGRADWGSNKPIAIAESSTALHKAHEVIRELKAQKIENAVTENVVSWKRSELYKVDTSDLPEPGEPYYA